ncbi:MAG TPA: hypothetical protein DEQ83_00890 [Rhodobiaceae bacterium]|nr:hypothetical protein [Rhodobiaceae bacterium]
MMASILALAGSPHRPIRSTERPKKMLDILRRSAGGVVGIFLIGLLVIAFALWGIADTFTGFSNMTLATVGDEPIERDEYRLRLRQQIQQVSQQIGEPLSVSQARSLGIDRRVLTDMLGMAALSGMAKDMGLAHSDEQVARQIINDPAFYGPTGKFDAPTFRSILRQNGLTEKMFVKDQREFHLRQQLMDSSVRQSLVPNALLSQMYRHVLEKRVARYLIVTLDATDEVGEPTEVELENFFSETKLRFTEPERRDGSVLLITPERFAETIKISDDEILAEYDLSVDEFSSPERRAIDQLVLNSDEEIEEINRLLSENRPFVEIVDAANQTLDDTDLGLITRDGLISSTLAERAFSMQAGEVSDIIEGPLGAVILRIRKIEEGTVRPYEEVRDILRDRLAYDRAVNEMIEFSETVEDERAAGIELEEIGQRFDLDVVKISSIDRDGNGGSKIDAQAEALISAYPALIQNIFDGAAGDDMPMIEMPDGTFAWVRLDQIMPSRVKPLEEVRADAIKQWQLAERGKLLEAMAEHFVKKGNESGSFKSVAKEFGRDPLTSEPMTRQVSNETFSEQAVEKLFSLQSGRFAWSRVGFGTDLIVMQAAQIIPPNADDEESIELIYGGERTKFQSDLTAQFVRALQNSFGLSINQQNIETALGELVAQ